MKSIIAFGVLALALSGAANAEDFEVCTTEGQCALRVTDTDTQEPVWLVTEHSQSLSLIWNTDGTYWLVSDEDYEAIRELVPEKMILPAVNPSTGITLAEAKGGSKPAPTPPPAPTSGGLISVGNITIGGGGNGACAECHKGSSREIHKKVLEQKN